MRRTLLLSLVLATLVLTALSARAEVPAERAEVPAERAEVPADTVGTPQPALQPPAAERTGAPLAIVATPEILVQRRFEMPPEYIAAAHPAAARIQIADVPLPPAA